SDSSSTSSAPPPPARSWPRHAGRSRRASPRCSPRTASGTPTCWTPTSRPPATPGTSVPPPTRPTQSRRPSSRGVPMADLARALEAADELLTAARPLLDPATGSDLQARLDAARRRHGHLGPTVVAALVGGTGSGKSSLL